MTVMVSPRSKTTKKATVGFALKVVGKYLSINKVTFYEETTILMSEERYLIIENVHLIIVFNRKLVEN